VSRGRAALLGLAALLAVACRKPAPTPSPTASASASDANALGPPAPPPAPRKGMVWIPGGALVAGTPRDSFPRIAEEEMPGEQVILHGFYMDLYPYPDEDGAIPVTNVSQAEARALCDEHEKRLCSELEWERACKGPENSTYEYGDAHKADRCGTGSISTMRPNGFLVACRSAFGVRDMHGGVWEWTSSPWGRGSERPLVTLRGGNATQGELVGRCANAMGRPPDTKSGNIGFRCCAGEKNDAEVVLQVVRGKALEPRAELNREIATKLLSLLPDEAKKDIGKQKFRFEREWIWRPIGNEELHVLGGCSGLAVKPACGILLFRTTLTEPKVLAWVSSGHWAPMLHMDTDPRDLWLFGGDDLGQFRRLVGYVWGRLSVGDKERNVPRPPKKKKKK
jgi:Sulfatase-modifying factor enzyme 1